MEALNYLPCRADPYGWMRKARKSDGTEYYEYMILKSIAPSDIYLVGKVKKTHLMNMVESCTFSSNQYVQEAVSNVEKFLQDIDGSMLSTKINDLLSNDYRTELGRSPELDGTDGVNINH